MWHDWVRRKRVGLCLLHLVSHFVTRNSQKEEMVIRFRVISDKFALLQVVKKEPSLVHFLLVRLLQGVYNNMTCSCLLLQHLGTQKKMNLHSISLYFFWKISTEWYTCSNNWNLSSDLFLPSGFKFWFVQFPELYIKDPKNIHIDLKQDCSRHRQEEEEEEEGQWIDTTLSDIEINYEESWSEKNPYATSILLQQELQTRVMQQLSSSVTYIFPIFPPI